MLQLEYFLGSVSMNPETFLGFSPVLRFSPLSGDTELIYILNGSVGSVQASHPKIYFLASIKYQPRNVSSYMYS